MREAMAEAEAAAVAGDVPVGAVVVDASGEIVGRGRNRREADQDPTAHAEVDALRRAAAGLGHWRIEGATVYVTLEPCPMCAGALVNARVARLVYGCPDPKAGAVDTLFTIGQDPRLNHRFAVEGGVLTPGGSVTARRRRPGPEQGPTRSSDPGSDRRTRRSRGPMRYPRFTGRSKVRATASCEPEGDQHAPDRVRQLVVGTVAVLSTARSASPVRRSSVASPVPSARAV